MTAQNSLDELLATGNKSIRWENFDCGDTFYRIRICTRSRMPIKNEKLPTAMLLSQFWSLPDVVLLTPGQATLFTTYSEEALKERRQSGLTPPAPMKHERGQAVWYPLGEVKKAMREQFPIGFEPRGTGANLSANLAFGAGETTWPCVLADDGRPTDYFTALFAGLLPLDGSYRPVLLSLRDYLERLVSWAGTMERDMSKRDLDALLTDAPATSCPRCRRNHAADGDCRL